MVRIAALTTVTMVAFAANSVLARLALLPEGSDPLAYTGIRLAAGAIALAVLMAFVHRDQSFRVAGSWAGAAALFGYALAFSVAYIMLGAGPGALILFASVQIGVIGWAILRGERPSPLKWLGLAIAFAGLVYLVSPSLAAPHPMGAALMFVAGLCWAAYTLIGRGSLSPLGDTTGNFIRCLPAALPLIVAGALLHGLDAGECRLCRRIRRVRLGPGICHLVHRAARPDAHTRRYRPADRPRNRCRRWCPAYRRASYAATALGLDRYPRWRCVRAPFDRRASRAGSSHVLTRSARRPVA